MDRDNRRSTYRTDIDISTLPFFGFHTQDGFPLEYFLINLSYQGLQIRVVCRGPWYIPYTGHEDQGEFPSSGAKVIPH